MAVKKHFCLSPLSGSLSANGLNTHTPITQDYLLMNAVPCIGIAAPYGGVASAWKLRLLLALLCLGSSIRDTCASNGRLVCWGHSCFGTPAGIFADVAVGGHYSVALRPDGTLVAWGNDFYGVVSGTPAGAFSSVAAGDLHAAALRQDGTVVSWGYDNTGLLSRTPTGNFAFVAAGGVHNVAIRSNGTLVSWGPDHHGVVSGTPTGTFSAVAAGSVHSVAIRTDGSLVSWGWDSRDQVSGTPSGTFSAVAAKSEYSVAMRTDGTLIAWGNDSFGQVSRTPTGTFSAVAAGSFHAVGLRPDGTLVSWGADNFGQVSGKPEGNFSAVAAGGNTSVAIVQVLNRSPVAQCQNVTVSAGAGCSAAASIDNGSFDPDMDDTVTLSQTPPGPYSLGQTIVTLTVTDNHGSSSQCIATVTVVDDGPPTLGPCPADQVWNANSPEGTVVIFPNPTASDNCSVMNLSCMPVSGSTFPIGTTIVICAAEDGSGNWAACTFAVKVKGAGEQLTDLIALLGSLKVHDGIKHALNVKLLQALAAVKANHHRAACARLEDFSRLVRAQKGKKLMVPQATHLLNETTRIRAVIGC